MIDKLEQQYQLVMEEIKADVTKLPVVTVASKEDRKTLGLHIQGKGHGLKHPTAMFSIMCNQIPALQKYVMNHIRPTGNAFRSME
jgi:hypothetical protein